MSNHPALKLFRELSFTRSLLAELAAAQTQRPRLTAQWQVDPGSGRVDCRWIAETAHAEADQR